MGDGLLLGYSAHKTKQPAIRDAPASVRREEQKSISATDTLKAGRTHGK